MKHYSVVLMMLIIQAAAPTPRWSAYASTNDHHDIKQQTKGDNSPPEKPSLSPNVDPSEKDGCPNKDKPSADKGGESIKIIEFPVVSVRTGPSEVVYLVFSGLLVIVGSLQAFFLFRSLKAIEGQSTHMQGQLVAIKEQAGIMERQTTATEKELVLVQRPRISAGAFYFREIKSITTGFFFPKGIEVGSDCDGQFYITNNGGTNAYIYDIFCTAIVTAALPMKRPYEGLDGEIVDITLSPAQSFTWMFHIAEPLDGATTTAIQVKSQGIYVLGRITYADELRIPRQKYFCHGLDYARDRFVPVDDPDYQSKD